jgi:hypothetical protein
VRNSLIHQASAANLAGIYSALRQTPPRNKQDLKNYVKVFLGLDVPDVHICEGHNSPMDYLWHCYSEKAPCNDAPANPKNADAVIWACRGGGKTILAAAATLLDCVFKPACQVRILGGSYEQSARMYEYLIQFTTRAFTQHLRSLRSRKMLFANGSGVEVLTQSATSVRGTHVQKLRCDEVELFDKEVFAAAQFVTHSTAGAVAALEAISTMHQPFGLMHQLVAAASRNRVPLFKWCLWEVIERCTDRNCSSCPLAADCAGRAKQATGYLKIDDAIAQQRRASRSSWQSEMLCEKPSLSNVVFAEFDPALHIASLDYDPLLLLYRALDFGFVNPFVCLWIQLDGSGAVRVIDEYVRSRATIDVNVEAVKARTPGAAVAATFCDPAGAGTSDITGTSTIRELRSLGIPTRYRRSTIGEGIELIRRHLHAGDGKTRLVISPRCQRLIEAMSCYHYPDIASGGNREVPEKDGLYDHPIDALRYFFVNYTATRQTASRRY